MTVRSAAKMAPAKLSISPVRLYRSDRIFVRLFSRPARSGWSPKVVESASSAFEMAARKSFLFPVRWYRFNSLFARLSSRPARSGWSSGVTKTASPAFEMAASKSFKSLVRLYRSDRTFARLFSRPARLGWSSGVAETPAPLLAWPPASYSYFRSDCIDLIEYLQGYLGVLLSRGDLQWQRVPAPLLRWPCKSIFPVRFYPDGQKSRSLSVPTVTWVHNYNVSGTSSPFRTR